jgi:hypothetical protein
MAASPSIMVKILGDVTGLGKSFTEAGQKGQSAAQGMHSAFSGMLGQLNSTGVLGPFGSALAAADQQIQSMEGHAKKSSEKMIGIGGAAAGVGFALSALGSKDQAAHQQLQASVQATGHSYEQYSGQVDAAIGHQEKFGHTADETQNALQVLTQATHNPTEALKLLNTATDLAAAKHEDLATAAGQVGKAYNGAGRIFKEFGITAVPTSTQATKALETATKASESAATASQAAHQHLSDTQAELAGKTTLTTAEHIKLRDAQEKVVAADAKAIDAHNHLVTAQHNATQAASGHNKAVDELGKKLAGQASASANTFTGHLKDMKAVVSDQVAQFGQKYGPAIGTAGLALAGLASAMKGASAAADALKLATIGQAIVSGVATAATWLWNAALTAAEVLELIVGAPIWLVIAAVVAFVAAVALAAYLIIKYWHDIAAAVEVAVGFIVAVWNGFIGFFAGIPGQISAIAVNMWNGVSGAFSTAWGAISGTWTTIWTWFTGLPGAITSAASGMWNGIGNAFIDVLNAVIGAWDDLHFSVPSVGFGPFHTPSFDLGLPTIPKIPHLAEGGLITQTGLIYAHAGEAITPAPAGLGAPAGPVLTIEHAHFDEMDTDVLMRRVAWLARSRGKRFSAA